MTKTLLNAPQRSIRRHALWGASLTLFLTVGVGGWAATTMLSGAVIATGTFVVDSHVKAVQHLKGGTVAAIRVRNGDRVQGGDVLVRLDDTQMRASLAIVTKRLDELTAREARLSAERDGEELKFPQSLTDVANNPLVIGERRLFDARRSSRERKKAQLTERISQLQQERHGLEAQRAGKSLETGFIDRELEGLRSLWKLGLVPVTKLNALEREGARLTGESGSLTASIAQTQGKVVETELQILQIDDDLRSEVAAEIRQIQAESGEYSERRIAAEDDLKRVDIRSPQAGIIHQLAVHGEGAVVTPGEPVMQIVPVSDALIAEVKIAPPDIDQLAMGQAVVLRLSAFNQRTTPELNGRISRIAADLTQEPQTGVSYYLARVSVEASEMQKLGKLLLVPGMPVEAFVQTGERTALSYFVKPLEDQITRAFKEE